MGQDHGQPSADEREELYRKALNSATRMLSRRQHAVRELETKLTARFDSDIVERVIARLGEQGFLDDQAFACEYARQRFIRSPRSALAVITELEGRGVGRSVAQYAVAGVMQEEGLSDETLAERAARKKLAALGSHGGKAQEKIYAFLASRGFSRSVARGVVLDVLAKE